MATARAAAWLSLLATTLVVAIKLWAAWASHSVSVLSEALQSLVDVGVSALAVFTLRLASRPPDEDHPFGHGKAEMLAGAFQMLVVAASCLYILGQAFLRFRSPEAIRWDFGAIAMGYALVSNTLMARFLRDVGRRTGSTVLVSEAIHLKGDSLASAGVLAGMIAVGATGWVLLDPLLAILFAVLALFSAVRQLRAVVHPLMDGALPEEQVAKVRAVLDLHPDVRGYHRLRTRDVGTDRRVELHVTLDDNLTFVEAHNIAERIEEEVSEALGGAKVEIHYEPHEAETEHQRRSHRSP
ncbi:MAG: cation diffusion facilitator family transporter [Fimbriimonadales bacterium]|nr:cation diffusion facilitator family transporter [Fimbriimonadales bacterium]